MEDFKKDSLIENYNRITRAKNNRLNEAGMYFGTGFVKEADDVPVSGDDGGEVTDGNLVNFIMDYEDGSLDDTGILNLFSYLIRTGKAWSLQGSYGRAAKSLIDQGYIDRSGKILQTPDEM
jgi:hypothetical protein